MYLAPFEAFRLLAAILDDVGLDLDWRSLRDGLQIPLGVVLEPAGKVGLDDPERQPVNAVHATVTFAAHRLCAERMPVVILVRTILAVF